MNLLFYSSKVQKFESYRVRKPKASREIALFRERLTSGHVLTRAGFKESRERSGKVRRYNINYWCPEKVSIIRPPPFGVLPLS